MTLSEIAEELLKTKKVALFAHVNPDCDCFGSMFALAEGLKSLGKKCDMFVDGMLNKFESQLFDIASVNKKEFKAKNYDSLVIVDCSALNRIGKYEKEFLKGKNTFRIDHHVCTSQFAKFEYIEDESSSNCEIIFELLNKLKVKITKEIATYLYCGLATDTYSFMNSNTNKRTYKIASKLVDLGVETVKINKLCFKSVTQNKLKLNQLYYKNLKIIDNRFAYIVVTDKDYKKTGTNCTDSDDFSANLLKIEGIELACCIYYKAKNEYKLSIRSTTKDGALQLARSFNGGGHTQAAGATIFKSAKTVEKMVVKKAKEILNKNA